MARNIITDAIREQIKEQVKEGNSFSKVARNFGISCPTVSSIINPEKKRHRRREMKKEPFSMCPITGWNV